MTALRFPRVGVVLPDGSSSVLCFVGLSLPGDSGGLQCASFRQRVCAPAKVVRGRLSRYLGAWQLTVPPAHAGRRAESLVWNTFTGFGRPIRMFDNSRDAAADKSLFAGSCWLGRIYLWRMAWSCPAVLAAGWRCEQGREWWLWIKY